MSSRVERKNEARRVRLAAEQTAARADRVRALRNRVLIAVGLAVVALAAVFVVNRAGGGSDSAGTNGKGSAYPYAVGNPGPGAPAPPLRLASTSGKTFDLSRQRGKTVLLYFQEGVGCQPCWDQIKDLEKVPGQLKALGIDEMVSITGNDLGQLRQKVADEGIKTPLLADPDLRVSKSYSANQYGMMGSSADGHSFLVVGPDGRIVQRADYGGAPNYTMYVPVKHLIADLRRGMRASRSQ